MKKYEVRWKELRYVNCSVEIEADSAEEAVEKAQAYDIGDVYETPGDCFEQFPAKVVEVEG